MRKLIKVGRGIKGAELDKMYKYAKKLASA